jgi:hypothetical protein
MIEFIKLMLEVAEFYLILIAIMFVFLLPFAIGLFIKAKWF